VVEHTKIHAKSTATKGRSIGQPAIIISAAAGANALGDLVPRNLARSKSARRHTPLEYVIVTFPDPRDVFVDNADDSVATTNQMFQVEQGTHYFNLGQPLNYSPATYICRVTGTIPAEPMKIPFKKVS
jgi:hypothetical protein